jgi:hypothetical protein
LHRWLGIGAFVFLLLLSATGLLLNHSTDLRLDERFVSSAWLLDWYGIRTPTPAASFASDGARVTLIGERLYFDTREVARGMDALLGAVTWRNFTAVATPDALLLFTPDGQLTERVQLPQGSGSIDRLGVQQPAHDASTTAATEHLVLASGDRAWLIEAGGAELLAGEQRSAAVSWSVPSDLPNATYEQLARLYRGDGITWERVMYDVHSGRLWSTAGTLVMDAVGVLLVVLSITGLVLWLRGRGRT